MKLCTKCDKPGEFGKDARKKDGLQSRCKACDTAAKRADYEARTEVLRERV